MVVGLVQVKLEVREAKVTTVSWFSLFPSVRRSGSRRRLRMRENFWNVLRTIGSKHTTGAPELPMEGLVAPAWKDVSKDLPRVRTCRNKQIF